MKAHHLSIYEDNLPGVEVELGWLTIKDVGSFLSTICYKNDNVYYVSPNCDDWFKVFDESDRQVFNLFKSKKRQVEWAAGRMAVKSVVMRYVDWMPNRIMIRTRNTGAPYLLSLPEWSISISHAGSYAMCCVSSRHGKKVGLDIECLCRAVTAEFMRVGFSMTERSHLSGIATDRVYANWTVKEAFLKITEKGFSENLHAVEVFNNELYQNGDRQRGLDIFTGNIDQNHIYSFIIY